MRPCARLRWIDIERRSEGDRRRKGECGQARVARFDAHLRTGSSVVSLSGMAGALQVIAVQAGRALLRSPAALLLRSVDRRIKPAAEASCAVGHFALAAGHRRTAISLVTGTLNSCAAFSIGSSASAASIVPRSLPLAAGLKISQRVGSGGSGFLAMRASIGGELSTFNRWCSPLRGGPQVFFAIELKARSRRCFADGFFPFGCADGGECRGSCPLAFRRGRTAAFR